MVRLRAMLENVPAHRLADLFSAAFEESFDRRLFLLTLSCPKARAGGARLSRLFDACSMVSGRRRRGDAIGGGEAGAGLRRRSHSLSARHPLPFPPGQERLKQAKQLLDSATAAADAALGARPRTPPSALSSAHRIIRQVSAPPASSPRPHPARRRQGPDAAGALPLPAEPPPAAAAAGPQG